MRLGKRNHIWGFLTYSIHILKELINCEVEAAAYFRNIPNVFELLMRII